MVPALASLRCGGLRYDHHAPSEHDQLPAAPLIRAVSIDTVTDWPGPIRTVEVVDRVSTSSDSPRSEAGVVADDLVTEQGRRVGPHDVVVRLGDGCPDVPVEIDPVLAVPPETQFVEHALLAQREQPGGSGKSHLYLHEGLEPLPSRYKMNRLYV